MAAAGGLFRDANGYLRDANGRFARGDGSTPGSSSGTRRTRSAGSRAGGVSSGSRKGGSRGRTVPEKVVLAGTDIGSERLRKSSDRRARFAGVVLSAAGSVLRNRNVRAAVRKGL